MSQVFIFDHPLIHDKMSRMRAKDTSMKEFRENLNEIAMLMGYEVFRDLPTKQVCVETPICTTEVPALADVPITIVPILRAGLGLVDGLQAVLPTARVGHIGMQRNETTHIPEEYYCKLPAGIERGKVFVVDPMLATGGSAIDAVDALKRRGVNDITCVHLVAAPEGVKALTDAHPDVRVFIAVLDDHLNEDAYIVPGLGDAGDRLYGTKDLA